MFRTLDLYRAISDLWPEIEFIFSFESTSAVRSLGINSLIKLSEAVRTMLKDFEDAVAGSLLRLLRSRRVADFSTDRVAGSCATLQT
ncbi:putative exocyst complex component Exo70, cullin repeat-like-containing domain-containing protein [Rosa chinensis]|uniref:Putative exocyst complex component Exo70, cullin repeat-like-containing domain-containing protein n=1 Tax=Rosa chinensis TaxID=74649 RepID=A0A2P6R9B2_ROSCH|nr:putative exocyst complex component Exo70, cullin repeat-like-containing domain-containing protein [Rosa chinensis]